MKSVNKVILIGRLGRDPELKYTGSGTPFCRFSIATDDTWNDKASGERQERTEWHNIVVWDRLAEICNEYLRKGRLVYIEGSLQTREWDDQDGNKRKTTEIRARDMVLLGSPQGEGGGAPMAGGQQRRSAPAGGAPQPSMSPADTGTITDDDIPF
jgi:single-strand DNA-binding protein